MKRRLTCCLAALVCLVFSCKEEPKAEELAAKAAENYYRLLMNGHYDRFVDGIAMSANIPFRDRLKSKEGIITAVVENARGFYVTVEFDE